MEVIYLPDRHKTEQIVNMYRMGESYEDIARAVHLSYATVVRTIAQSPEGQAVRNQQRKHRIARLNQAVALYLNGEKIEKIYKSTGIAGPPLYAELKERGITPNRLSQAADASAMEGAVAEEDTRE